jgi:hypothetical protein
VPLLPPPRLAGERDTRLGCWGAGGGCCCGAAAGGCGPRLLVLALVLDCNEMGLSESRSRFAVGLDVGRGRSPTDASS